MKNLKNYFRSNISDIYYEISKENQPKEKILNELYTKLMNELKEGKLEDKKVSYEKIFILYLFKYNIKNYNFNILELVSSKDLHLKLLGYILSSNTFDDDSNSLLMIQNLLKNDLNSKVIINKTLSLTFLAKFLNLDYFDHTKKEIMNIIKNKSYGIKENHFLQQKGICCLKKILKDDFNEFFNLFVIEDFCNDLINEKNLSLLCSKLSILEFSEEQIRENQKLLYFIKPLFLLLDTKSSWILIKVIKILKKFLLIEKRIIVKLDIKFKEILNKFSFKSAFIEILELIIEFDGFSEDLIIKCFSIISQLFKNKDKNIISLIWEIFNIYLNNIKKEDEIEEIKIKNILVIIQDNLNYITNLNVRPDLSILILLNLSIFTLKLNSELILIDDIHKILNKNKDDYEYFKFFAKKFLDNIDLINLKNDKLIKIFVDILPLWNKEDLIKNKIGINNFLSNYLLKDIIIDIKNNSLINNDIKEYLIKFFIKWFFERREYLKINEDELMLLLNKIEIYIKYSSKFLFEIKLNLAINNDNLIIESFNKYIKNCDQYEDLLDYILAN